MSDASQLPLWVDYSKALLTPVIAAFGVGIAWQQWRTNKAHLSERLFDRRMEIFEKAQHFLTEFARSKNAAEIAFPEFRESVWRSRFLFSAEVTAHLTKILNDYSQIKTIQASIDATPAGELRIRLQKQNLNLSKKLNDLPPQLYQVFEGDMSFRKRL